MQCQYSIQTPRTHEGLAKHTILTTSTKNGLNITKVEIDQARLNNQVRDGSHALAQHFIRQLECFDHTQLAALLCQINKTLIVCDNHGVDVFLKLAKAYADAIQRNAIHHKHQQLIYVGGQAKQAARAHVLRQVAARSGNGVFAYHIQLIDDEAFPRN
jgi:hypothetical protein